MKKIFIPVFVVVLISVVFLMVKNKSNLNKDNANISCDINIVDKKFVSGNLVKTKTENCQFQLPAEQRNKIILCNQDDLPMEFESHDLHLEKIVKAKGWALLNVMKLEKGKKYKFFEEFYGEKCEFIGI